MARQKRRRAGNTWEVEEREDGLWVSRLIPPRWQLEHRVVLQGGTPVIAETRVRASGEGPVPQVGLGSDVLRRITVSGVREAAARRLLPAGAGNRPDLRTLESLSPSARRQGEARRWSLALTGWAYVQAVEDGSRSPNEDVAAALGIEPRSVRDRLYAARHMDPPLLTGGGRKGMVGRPELTDAGVRAMEDRLERVMASLGLTPGGAEIAGFNGTLEAFVALQSFLLQDAERRIPDLWEMDLDEIARHAPSTLPLAVEVPAGKGPQIGPAA